MHRRHARFRDGEAGQGRMRRASVADGGSVP